jgi:hypothetical protein
MIEGLQTGNAALVSAAADQMHANSADVGGNNIPVNGGTYNPDGLTVADVLSTAGAPAAVAAATAPGDAVPAAPAVVATAAATTVAADTGTHDHAPAAVEIHEPAFADSAHHFHHMWGSFCRGRQRRICAVPTITNIAWNGGHAALCPPCQTMRPQ